MILPDDYRDIRRNGASRYPPQVIVALTESMLRGNEITRHPHLIPTNNDLRVDHGYYFPVY